MRPTLIPRGKCVLMAHQLHVGACEAAMETIDAVDEDDLRQAPALRPMVAMLYLLSAVPAELREIVSHNVPLFDAANFPLHSDADAVEARRKARRLFAEAVEAARELNCPDQASAYDKLRLWLELTDPECSEKGRQRLLERLSDLKSALGLIPLALQFGIKLDLAAVEQEIERQIALHGGMLQEAEIVRFVLVVTQKHPREVADYIARHEEELSGYVVRKAGAVYPD